MMVINPFAIARALGNPRIEVARGGVRRGITIAAIIVAMLFGALCCEGEWIHRAGHNDLGLDDVESWRAIAILAVSAFGAVCALVTASRPRRWLKVLAIVCLGFGAGLVFEIPMPATYSLGNAAIAFLVLQLLTIVATLSIPIAPELVPRAKANP